MGCALTLLAVGLALVGWALTLVVLGFATFRWKCTEGETVEAVLRTSFEPSGGSKRYPRYHIRLKYVYEVDGQEYESNLIRRGDEEVPYTPPRRGPKSAQEHFQAVYSQDYADQCWALRRRRAWPDEVGKKVKVYYDPREPSRSVLRRGVDVGMLLFLLAIGLAITFLGGYGLVDTWPRK